MSWIEAILLGIVQGLTEFLPVSSSGHLAIGKALFGIETADLSFEVIVHAATVLATIVVFWKDILALLQGLFKFKFNAETRYICLILLSMIPVFIVGMFFKDQVESIFGSGLLVVGFALLVTAFLLFLSETLEVRRAVQAGNGGGQAGNGGQKMTWKSALWMGLAQAVAVIPGLSRSGSTIATGLICGVKKEEVTRFSFLMVLIPILGEAFLDVVGGDFAQSSVGVLPLILGFLAAFVSGLFACRVMIAMVKKARLRWFALYCAIVGLICIVSHLF
ncbi:MAG: undecaprenyl-diphosphate phosphatase [Bacteroidales bacterium]|nr:undecaprenyl-diphosphate phosphatase [Bacteroidales bacterium]